MADGNPQHITIAMKDIQIEIHKARHLWLTWSFDGVEIEIGSDDSYVGLCRVFILNLLWPRFNNQMFNLFLPSRMSYQWQGSGYQDLHSAWEAKYYGCVVECNIAKENIEVPTHCPILNIPLVFTHSKQQPDSPSLHRIDSSKGYVKDNVCVVCWRASDLLKDAALAELVAITVWMAAVT